MRHGEEAEHRVADPLGHLVVAAAARIEQHAAGCGRGSGGVSGSSSGKPWCEGRLGVGGGRGERRREHAEGDAACSQVRA